MIGAIALLLTCQLLGEIIHRAAGLPLPGSVIGMLLLIGWLAAWRKQRPSLNAVTGWLTAHLAILFVPASVGVMEQGALLRRYGVALVLATSVSTIVTLVVTALVFAWAARCFGGQEVSGHEAEQPGEGT